MKIFILISMLFLFTACSSKKEAVKPKFTGAYPTGQKYSDVYHSRGFDYGYSL